MSHPVSPICQKLFLFFRFLNSPTHPPVSPICSTPFPPHVRNECSFSVCFRAGVVFFVNSGSEANDLALRLVRAFTRRKRCLVLDRAYHGHTIGTLNLSPYKFSHSSSEKHGQPSWVTICPAPDTYRGQHRDADAAAEYAGYVERACELGNVGGFSVESGMSVAGAIISPMGYLERCYKAVRAQGGCNQPISPICGDPISPICQKLNAFF